MGNDAVSHATSDGSLDAVEIRIHGVKDHSEYSSLGTPALVSDPAERLASTVRLADQPPHTLWLFNWSRTSRSLGGLIWYAMLPFTLLNVAGQTGSRTSDHDSAQPVASPGGSGDPWVGIVIGIQGAVLSCTALVWTIAFVETLYGHFPLPVQDVERGVLIVCGASLFILLAFLFGNIMGSRARETVTRRSRLRFGTVTLLTVLVTSALTWWLVEARPAHQDRWAVEPGSLGSEFLRLFGSLPFLTAVSPFPVTSPDSPCYLADDVVACYAEQSTASGGVYLVDVLSTSVVVGFVVSALLATVLLVKAIWVRWAERRSDRVVGGSSLAAAALLVMGSWVMLVAFSSAFRQGVQWVMDLAAPFLPRPAYHVFAHQPYFSVLPYKENPYVVTLYDCAPVIAVIGLAAFGVCLAVSGLFLRPGEQDFTPAAVRGSRSMLYFHRTIDGLQGTLPFVVLASGVLWALGVFGFVRFLLWLANPARSLDIGDPRNMTPEQREALIAAATRAGAFTQLLLLAITLVGVVAVLFALTSNGNGKLSQIFDIVADIAGFWPREWHPLAGASYRHRVMKALTSTCALVPDERQLILVGHSQGSVIAYWYAARVDRSPKRLDLVTCGSPLQTLYAMAFPRWFAPARRAEVAARVRSWSNVWRATDPIASELAPAAPDAGSPGIRNRQIADPADNRKKPKVGVRGHGDYWTDASHVQVVAALTAPPD